MSPLVFLFVGFYQKVNRNLLEMFVCESVQSHQLKTVAEVESSKPRKPILIFYVFIYSLKGYPFSVCK